MRAAIAPCAPCWRASTTSAPPIPNIQVTGADLKGNRTLFLSHDMHRGIPLHNQTKELVLAHVERLWGHDVKLEEQAA